ncbi:MAG: heavy metal translocating P-type ATPase [Deltaproteobacteria bacterium]|nr:heavy metal translocating P-type ATPase [Deltaproteobacteria bacterium]
MGDAAGPCALCGLPAPTAAGSDLSFCCSGCRNVFEMLSRGPGGPPADFRDTDAYRWGVAAGLIPGGPVSAPTAATVPAEPGLTQELVFRAEGMWCPACSWWIEEVLRRTEGVVDARVSFASDRVTVRHLPHRVSAEAVLDRVSGLGYGASRLEDAGAAREGRQRLLRLGVSAILTANLMMISMALYGGFFADLGPDGVRYLSLPQWALATPVVFYGGLPILRRAWGGFRAGGTSMDTLLAVGILSAYLFSVAGVVGGSLHLYFDTSATLVTLALAGRFIEGRARERVARQTADLYEWAGRKARLWTEGKEQWVASAAVSPGNEVVVRTGERVPVDGSIVRGRATLDGSSLTGEARPVQAASGDEVSGGALVREGEIRIRARRTASESAAGRMIALMEEALVRRAPAELLADRLTRWLVPAVLCLAVAAAVAVSVGRGSAEEALRRALSVLVVTCPCALGLATPLAKVAALGAGRSRGILVRDPGALERIPELDVVVLDKTGTVTDGDYALREVVAEGVDGEEALRRAASVAQRSEHTVARALVREARERGLSLEDPGEVEEGPGRGVTGTAQGARTAVGSRRLMMAEGFAIPASLARRQEELEARGLTTAWAGWAGGANAVFSFGDALKPEAVCSVEHLRARGLALWLVSGDSPGATGAVARSLGIDRFLGNARPEDKVALLADLRNQGSRVAMVGDGINDAPALAEADVGIALGAGADFLCQAADVVILSDDPGQLASVFALAGRATRVVRQNLFFAFFYNLLALPLAVSGLLNPLVAALAMLSSSLTVVGNTLRVARR